MKHLVIHLAIALATFVIGTTTQTLFPFHSYSETKAGELVIKSRAEEEAKITEVVFRRQIWQDANAPMSHYYLSCYNYADPSAQIMARLMQSPAARVRKLSELPLDHNYRNDEWKVFLRVGRIGWINDNEVMVGVTYRSGWNMTRAYIFHLARENGAWRVKSSETIS
jgi:hypothetical protein